MSETLDFLPQNLDQGWSLGSEAFSFVYSMVVERAYRSLIEFGSGQSTVGWVRALPDLTVTSFEHDQVFCEETKRLLAQHQLADRARVHFLPLRTVWIDGRPFQTYTRPQALPQTDFVFIDGPPAHTRRGREACLYYSYNYLRVGGAVVLDDANRPDEQQTVSNWMTVYPGSFELERVDIGHGLALLYKIKHVSRNRMALDVLWDSYSVQAEKLFFGLKRAAAVHLFAHDAAKTESKDP